MKFKERGPINHLIRIYSLKDFFKYFIGFDPRKRMAVEDWLVIPQQALLEVTAGEVYYDQIGLEKYRHKFAYYPQDVWLYMMHIQWDRLANLLGFPSRVAIAGDEFGSRLIANQVVMEIINMMFLLERKYMPYLKWRGRALRDLANGPRLVEIVEKIHGSKSWKERQRLINRGHMLLGEVFNSLEVAPAIPLQETSFNERAYNVVDLGPFAKASFDAIKSKKLRNASYPLGSIDQFFNHVKPNQLDYIYREFRNFVV